jgi:hypothetical protein
MTRTTGIWPQDVAGARTVDQVLAELDAEVLAEPLLLVAQRTPVEASLPFGHFDQRPPWSFRYRASSLTPRRMCLQRRDRTCLTRH